ncbi:MAG: hypothetical protein ABIO24_09285 [Saprospiraceae bacterium]
MTPHFCRSSAFLLFLVLLATACGDRQTATPKALDTEHFAYFPLQIGKYMVFSVDSIVYDFAAGGTVQDSSHTLAREEITDTLRDNTGQLLYKIERSERPDQNAPWELRSITTAGRSATQAMRTENNFRFLKLIFPLDKRSEWDGNLWVDQNLEIEIAGERMRPFTNWQYEVDSIDIPGQIGAFAFDSLLVVTEADDNNVIERRFSRVKYAKHVGVVWREQLILDSQYCNQNPPPVDCATKPWIEKAEKGYILRQTVLEFN